MSERRAQLLLVITVVIWGWSFVASKILLAHVSPAELVGLRLLLGFPLLLGLARAARVRLVVARADLPRLLLASLVLAGHFLLQLTGLRTTTATSAVWLIAVTPLLIALLARVLLGERLGRLAGVGLTAATAGVVLLVTRGELARFSFRGALGDWLVLASALSWAVYTTMLRDLSRRYHPLLITTVAFGPPLLVALALMVPAARWSVYLALPPLALASLAFLAIFATAVAHWFWQAGVSRIGAARAGLFLYLEPVSTTALAVPLLGEPFGVSTALGGLLVLAGVYLGSFSRRG